MIPEKKFISADLLEYPNELHNQGKQSEKEMEEEKKMLKEAIF